MVSEQETFSIFTAERVSIVVVSDCRRTQRVVRTVAIEQPIDQVQVAEAAAAHTNSQLAGQVRFGAHGKGGDLFVSHTQPLDLAPAVAWHRSARLDCHRQCCRRV